MENYSRYAVYYAPAPGPLATFAAGWLGWDPVARAEVEHPDLGLLPREVEDITSTPRKYGFHGTIKPPFRLAQGSDRAALEADIATLAGRLAPVALERLALKSLGGFLALIPTGDNSALAALAAEVVTSLDTHRAPPPAEELAKRRASGLSARQEELLAQWGYPYVMDEFRFHLTLSRRLDEHEAVHLADTLSPRLDPILPCPFEVKDLCLFGEAEDGRFHLLHRYALSG